MAAPARESFRLAPRTRDGRNSPDSLICRVGVVINPRAMEPAFDSVNRARGAVGVATEYQLLGGG